MNSIATIVLLVISLSIGIVSGQTNPPSEVPTYTGPFQVNDMKMILIELHLK